MTAREPDELITAEERLPKAPPARNYPEAGFAAMDRDLPGVRGVKLNCDRVGLRHTLLSCVASVQVGFEDSVPGETKQIDLDALTARSGGAFSCR